MKVTITDPALIEQLQRANDTVTFQTPDGQVVAVLTPDLGVPPAGVEPPFSTAELAEFEKQKSGRPLADILRDIGKSL